MADVPATAREKPVLFSGLQPTGGGVMLGNFLGALSHWVRMQDSHDSLFCIVDLHAVTVRQDPRRLREQTYRTAATYLACGIDPERATLFTQSHVPAHCELAWLLTCHTGMGELSRMTQFKDKSAKGLTIGTGLFTYPTLMAADILLYQSALVPVGEDQKQHLELTRDLALRMNAAYGPLFHVPEVFIPPVGARIMNLADPTRKMSKSDENPEGTVFLSDPPEVIARKFKRAVTDSLARIADREEQPGIRNLINIQCAIKGSTPASVVRDYEGKGYAALKSETAELVIAALAPVRERTERWLSDLCGLDRILKQGAERAAERAHATMRAVREAMGFAPRD